MPNRKPKPELPRPIALTATEVLYECLSLDCGLTIPQIAEKTGRSCATVRNALFKAREKRRDLENMKVIGK